jgi:hypothetical protein
MPVTLETTWFVAMTWYVGSQFYAVTKEAHSEKDAETFAKNARNMVRIPDKAEDLEVGIQRFVRSSSAAAWQAASPSRVVVLETSLPLAPGATDPTAAASAESTRYWVAKIRKQLAELPKGPMSDVFAKSVRVPEVEEEELF